MSFPRYPEYKDSGVEWIGKVPTHWHTTKLKSTTTFSGGGTPSRENLLFWNGNIPWVSLKDMKFERIVATEESITELGLQSGAANKLSAGHVLIVVRSGILKHTIPVAINDISVALNQDMKALWFDRTACEPRFFLRWVQGLNDQLLLAWAKQGATVESIEQSYLANTEIPLPPVPEQQQILSFLDRETAKIDALIAEQERLMELLKEKRQAVISHAVTKGLNPDAPMKDSGVEWLGEVPAHWEVLPIQRLIRKGTSITYGIVQAGPDIEGGIPYIRTSDMSADELPETGYMRTSTEIDASYTRSKVRRDDLVVAIRASVGKGLLVPQHLEGANLTQGTARVSPSERLTSQFLLRAFNSDYCQTSIKRVAKGSTFLEITLDALRRLPIALPPINEQNKITSVLERNLSEYSQLSDDAERGIKLLQERRIALVSAAVTGQIDVRNLLTVGKK